MNAFDEKNNPTIEVIPWLFHEQQFVDSVLNSEEKIDVIIPLLHSNQLWIQNLKSYYREIPIGKLLIGDAGAIDGSIESLKDFPRVQIFDHKGVSTLGKSIALLIEQVESPLFVYLQSDVALPPGWLKLMKRDLSNFDWIGSPMHLCVLADYRNDFREHRPLAGAQLGRTSAFHGVSKEMDDDYIYRQEDFVFANYVQKNGFKVGNSAHTYHLHQLMRRKTKGEENNIQSIDIRVESSPLERARVDESQMKGMLKYTSPSYGLARKEVMSLVRITLNRDPKLILSYLDFARNNAPDWVVIIKRSVYRGILSILRSKIKSAIPLLRTSQIHVLVKSIFS